MILFLPESFFGRPKVYIFLKTFLNNMFDIGLVAAIVFQTEATLLSTVFIEYGILSR